MACSHQSEDDNQCSPSAGSAVKSFVLSSLSLVIVSVELQLYFILKYNSSLYQVVYYITGTAKSLTESPSRGPEVQKEPLEGTPFSDKVARPNASANSEQPDVLTPPDSTLDSFKTEDGKQKEFSDTRVYASLPKPTDNADDPRKEKSSQNILKRPDSLPLFLNRENVISRKASSDGPETQGTDPVQSPESPLETQEDQPQVVMRTNRGRARSMGSSSLSPDLSEEESPSVPDNIAFMITKTKVQALSTGEYQQLVNSNDQDVETVKVGMDETVSTPEDDEFGKKPVIIVFDEPMDIRMAYKRLSTIFECEEELDRSLSRECIIEDNEDIDDETESQNINKVTSDDRLHDRYKFDNHLQVPGRVQIRTESGLPESENTQVESLSDPKQDAKKKFKFKFPKKQLAAIGQALRTGTKTGKKTLQVVVYEDEEEPDGTFKEAREAKRFEISTSVDYVATTVSTDEPSSAVPPEPSVERTSEICQTTYKTLDSLEETIKQLETTITNMDPGLSPEESPKDFKGKRASESQSACESSPPKKPPPIGPKPQKLSQRKKPKVHCVRLPSSSSSFCYSSAKQVSPQ